MTLRGSPASPGPAARPVRAGRPDVGPAAAGRLGVRAGVRAPPAGGPDPRGYDPAYDPAARPWPATTPGHDRAATAPGPYGSEPEYGWQQPELRARRQLRRGPAPGRRRLPAGAGAPRTGWAPGSPGAPPASRRSDPPAPATAVDPGGGRGRRRGRGRRARLRHARLVRHPGVRRRGGADRRREDPHRRLRRRGRRGRPLPGGRRGRGRRRRSPATPRSTATRSRSRSG